LQRYIAEANLGNTPNSRGAYIRQARLFVAWLDATGRDLQTIARADLGEWRRTIANAAPATQAAKVGSVRKLLAWASDEGALQDLTAEDLQTRTPSGQRGALATPPVPRKPIRRLTGEELRLVVNAPFALTTKTGKQRKGTLRDAVALALMGLHGLRESEVCELRVGDLQPKNGGAVLTVRGKGRKERALTLAADMLRLIRAYLQQTGRKLGNGDRDSYLLQSQRGERLTRSALFALVREVGRRVLSRDDLTPHWLRRTWATHISREVRNGEGNLLKAAMPAPRLQREAGWASLQTAQNYVDAAAEEDEAPTAFYLGIAAPTPANGAEE
jgi:integrase/recombinase XerD